jgi:hypothetical protein
MLPIVKILGGTMTPNDAFQEGREIVSNPEFSNLSLPELYQKATAWFNQNNIPAMERHLFWDKLKQGYRAGPAGSP